MKKIRLAVVIPTLEGGGTQRMVAELLHGFPTHFDVHLVLCQYRVAYSIPRHVTIHLLHSAHSPNHSIIIKLWRLGRRVFSLRSVLRSGHYDVILSFLDMNNVVTFLANRLVSRRAPLLLVEQLVGEEFLRYERHRRRTNWLWMLSLRFAYQRASLVIVLSATMQRYVREVIGVDRETEIIYNGVNSERFFSNGGVVAGLDERYSSARVRLLHVGRLCDQKNQEFLIRLFPRILECVPEAELFIVGVGENERPLRDVISRLALDGRVHLLGWKDNVADYMRLADVFLLCSNYESFGNVIPEALACGVPVVTTGCSGVIFEILENGRYGAIVPVGDASGYLRAVLETLGRYGRNPGLKEEIAAYVESRFGMVEIKKRYIELILQMTDGATSCATAGKVFKSAIPGPTLAGWVVHRLLWIIPGNARVPILRGRLRGKKWIVGSSNHSCWLGVYEYRSQVLAERVVQRGMVVFDLGAQAGFFSLLYSALVGTEGEVFAFEPLPRNLLYLKRHLELNDVRNVSIIEAAVSDVPGEVQFDDTPGYLGAHISNKGRLRVRAVSLDDLVARGKVPPPGLIKIDVEGAEGRVLRGAESLLRHHSPVVVLSIHGSTEGELGRLREECCGFLTSIGYSVDPMDSPTMEESREIVGYPRAEDRKVQVRGTE